MPHVHAVVLRLTIVIVTACCVMGCRAVGAVFHPPLELYRDLDGVPGRMARGMLDPKATPDQQRQGINYLVYREWGRVEPYTTIYARIAENAIEPKPDYTVRAVAIRSLNRSRDASATPIFISALDDSNQLVRLEAAKALSNLPDPNAVAPLLSILEGQRDIAVRGRVLRQEEDRDIRIASADALRHYPTLPVARALVSQLNRLDFGVAWQSRQSLKHLTGQDFAYDESAWLNYLAETSNPFIPA